MVGCKFIPKTDLARLAITVCGNTRFCFSKNKVLQSHFFHLFVKKKVYIIIITKFNPIPLELRFYYTEKKAW